MSAGVVEDGKRKKIKAGIPQGASLSPLLANIYLHYVLDLWAQRWRTTRARGEMIIVRYADDFVVGFQHQADAERFRHDLNVRMRAFSLLLHPDKTRLICFGRFAIRDRRNRGESKPETFDFLGFTHVCSLGRTGNFVLRRLTTAKRMRAKLRETKYELMRRRHQPVPEQGAWLASVVRGYFAYQAVPTNSQRSTHELLPNPGDTSLVPGASAPQPTDTPDVGEDEAFRQQVDPTSSNSAPVALRKASRLILGRSLVR